MAAIHVHEVLDFVTRRYLCEIKMASIVGNDRRYDGEIADNAYNVLVAKKELLMINDEEFNQADDVLADMDEEYHDWLMYFHLYNKWFIKERIDAPEY